MAVTAKWYGNGLLKAFNKEVDWDTDTIKVALLANTYTPDQDVHDYFDDVVASEVSGTGYTAGGETLGTKTATYDGATNVVKLDAADVSWAASTITARYAVIYVATGVNTTSTLLGYVDFGADVSSSSGAYTLTWHADGILKVTAA